MVAPTVVTAVSGGAHELSVLIESGALHILHGIAADVDHRVARGQVPGRDAVGIQLQKADRLVDAAYIDLHEPLGTVRRNGQIVHVVGRAVGSLDGQPAGIDAHTVHAISKDVRDGVAGVSDPS